MLQNILSKLAIMSVITMATSNIANAAEFSVTWNNTITNSPFPYNVGEAMSVTMVLDNGGTDAVSQTWSSDDLVSVTIQLNNGAITTVFDGSGLDLTTGSFVTDASGVLTAVPSAWGNFTAGMPVTFTNDPLGNTDIRWVINGLNYIYSNFSLGFSREARAADPASNIIAANWSNPVALNPAPTPPTGTAPIPTMSVYGLVIMTLGLLVIARRKLPA